MREDDAYDVVDDEVHADLRTARASVARIEAELARQFARVDEDDPGTLDRLDRHHSALLFRLDHLVERLDVAVDLAVQLRRAD